MKNYVETTVQAGKTDAQVQREYLRVRLNSASYDTQKLRDFFHLDGPNQPETYKQLIDAIKNGEYSLDLQKTAKVDTMKETRFHNPFYGIVWTKFPEPDRLGYNAACTDRMELSTKAADIIMTGDAAAGLKALQDFEAWMPTPATTVAN